VILAIISAFFHYSISEGLTNVDKDTHGDRQDKQYLKDFDDTFFICSDVNSLKNFAVLSAT